MNQSQHEEQGKPIRCGQVTPTGPQYNNFNAGGFTTLNVGANTLIFRETIVHRGAPFRIALSFGTDDGFNQYVLLDHIPHNPLSYSQARYIVNVTVPDVNCRGNCSLQLVQIMTDKFTTPCQPSDLVNSCGSRSYVYFSCANVHIPGTQPPSTLSPIYTSYLGTPGPTPWRPGEEAGPGAYTNTPAGFVLNWTHIPEQPNGEDMGGGSTMGVGTIAAVAVGALVVAALIAVFICAFFPSCVGYSSFACVRRVFLGKHRTSTSSGPSASQTTSYVRVE